MTARRDRLDFDMVLESEGGRHYARVLSSPAGEASGRFEFPFSDLELESFLMRVGRTRSRLPRSDSAQMEAASLFGTRLYEAVFSGEVGSAYRRSLDEAERAGYGLRLRLRLGDPALSVVPWEFMYSPSLARFLVLSAYSPIVRYHEPASPRQWPIFIQPPLRILVIVSSPSTTSPVDVGRERQRLAAGLADIVDGGLVELRFLERATLRALQAELRRAEHHVLHFEGHAGFDERTGEGGLLFEDDQGRSRLVDGRSLGALIYDVRTLSLVVFDGCAGARGGTADPFAGVSQEMVRGGVSAVIAMQFEMTDVAATAFSHELYSAVADGHPVDTACTEARKAVLTLGTDVEWAAPALHMRVPDGVLFHIDERAATVRVPETVPVPDPEPGFPAPPSPPTGGDVDMMDADVERIRACETVEDIAAVHRSIVLPDLADGLTSLKRRFLTVSGDVEAALAGQSAFQQRDGLSRVETQLQGLARELEREARIARAPGPSLYQAYAGQFAPIAAHWSDILAATVRSLEAREEQLQEIGSPYVVGVPLRDEQPVFVGRSDISARIESLLLHEPAPSLLLYGQRRMGKTSLLNNMGRLLPDSIVPLFVDLQGPPGHAEGHSGLLFHLADAMAVSARRQLPDLSVLVPAREAFSQDPFTRFYEWLDDFDSSIEGRAPLLMLDEFEALDRAFDDGRVDADLVLGMLRNLIQHRTGFKVLLAGSHTLERFKRWSSYLINVQVVKVGYLTETEARSLIEHPVAGFPLRYDPKATSRVVHLTGCHPFLVQLLCAEIVALKNEQPPARRRRASEGDVEEAVPRALESGSMFFYDIERNQIDPNALALLQTIARAGEGARVRERHVRRSFSGDVDAALDLLRRRDVIEQSRGRYRVSIEMVRRWFAR